VSIHVTIETIDPDIARVYLTKNIEHNRKVAEWKVDQYANEMREGKWVETSATIKFDEDGHLIDGQHRLLALIDAEVTLSLVVSRGEPKNAVYVIDTGMARSTAQSLTVAGITSSGLGAQVSATANVLQGIENGFFRHAMGGLSKETRLTNQEMVEYVGPRVEEIIEANKHAHVVYRSVPLNTSVMAAAYIVLARIDKEAADEFYRLLAEGVSEGTGDPILTLTRRAVGDRMSNKSISQATALFLVFRAWNAWRDGETMRTMPIGSPGAWASIPVPH
jgi:hypothetical protein